MQQARSLQATATARSNGKTIWSRWLTGTGSSSLFCRAGQHIVAVIGGEERVKVEAIAAQLVTQLKDL